MTWTEETQMEHPMWTLKDDGGETIGRVLPVNSTFAGVLYVQAPGFEECNHPIFLTMRFKALPAMKAHVEYCAGLYHGSST